MSPPSTTTSIRLTRLRELWVHTGTACNLSCPFCHEGSKPGDGRIAAPTLAQLAPLLDEAAAHGVGRFAFTGGEPLILKGILEILLHALRLRPVLVLTNGTAPFIRRSHQLALLRAAGHELTFRVSIDFADEARHDAARGLKNFRKALEGLRLLHVAGFPVGITRQRMQDEDAVAVEAQFRRLLRKQGLPEDLPIVPLPDLAAFGAVELPGPRTDAGTPGAPAIPPQCSSGRMLLIRDGAPRFHACPLTDDAERFDAGASLQEALAARVTPDHPRCKRCLDCGVDYAGAGL
ncbi:MAG TPA: radical SAM protein [Steroidobacteraceae bacterium]|nr:radical SAM protein [Steroidobacteraceae bacterium]